jgi:hypothetical protein
MLSLNFFFTYAYAYHVHVQLSQLHNLNASDPGSKLMCKYCVHAYWNQSPVAATRRKLHGGSQQ